MDDDLEEREGRPDDDMKWRLTASGVFVSEVWAQAH